MTAVAVYQVIAVYQVTAVYQGGCAPFTSLLIFPLCGAQQQSWAGLGQAFP